MDVCVTEKGNVSVLALTGRMDAITTCVFEDACRQLLETGKTTVVLDLKNLEYISSAGLRGILGMVKALKAASGVLAFCALQPMVSEVFRISGFSAMLPVHATLDDALAALDR